MMQATARKDDNAVGSNQNRYFDPKLGIDTVQVLPGDYYVTGKDELVTTVLGSCISVCLRDPVIGVGGINHFMLPGDKKSGKGQNECARYGVHAMEVLINSLLKLSANKNVLEVKMFGGGSIISGTQDLGKRNIEFARQFLKVEGFSIMSEDVGLPYSRKIRFRPSTGAVMVKRLRSMHNNHICETEKNYELSLSKSSDSSEQELF